MRPAGKTLTATHPTHEVARDGDARLLRCERSTRLGGEPGCGAVLLVPSLLTGWRVFDFAPGRSLTRALADAGIDVFIVDWGRPGSWSRDVDWSCLAERLRRMERLARRSLGGRPLVMVGYSVSGTLSVVRAALDGATTPLAGLVNLAGPVDFSKAGEIARRIDPAFYDVDAVAAAGNPPGPFLWSGFAMLRPFGPLQRLAHSVARPGEGGRRAALADWARLERWGADIRAFPAQAYATYVRDLYQQNQLVAGTHRVGGRTVDLGAIACPVLTLAFQGDRVCPPAAATALHQHLRHNDHDVAEVPGNHVSALVVPGLCEDVHARLAAWIERRCSEARPEQPTRSTSRSAEAVSW